MFVFVEEMLLFLSSPLPQLPIFLPLTVFLKMVGRQSSDKIPFDRMGALIYFADKDCG